jgi:chromodomain-helicase-DNA-binding protein 4
LEIRLASWDSPPRRGDFGYAAFEVAFQRFLVSRSVTVPSPKKAAGSDKRPKDDFRRKYMLKGDAQPDLGQSNHLKLMPFQVCRYVLWTLFLRD